MPLRPCLGLPNEPCDQLTTGSRCPEHRHTIDAEYDRRKRERRPHTYAEDQRRAAVVAEHRAAHGDWCPGWQRPAHESSDLTADHVVAFAINGDESSELGVLCRTCNSAKAATVMG